MTPDCRHLPVSAPWERRGTAGTAKEKSWSGVGNPGDYERPQSGYSQLRV